MCLHNNRKVTKTPPLGHCISITSVWHASSITYLRFSAFIVIVLKVTLLVGVCVHILDTNYCLPYSLHTMYSTQVNSSNCDIISKKQNLYTSKEAMNIVEKQSTPRKSFFFF